MRVGGCWQDHHSDLGTDYDWPLSRCRCPARSLSTPRNPSKWRGQCEGLSAKPGFCRRKVPCLPIPQPRLSAFLFPPLTLVLSSCGHRYTAECRKNLTKQQMPPAQSPCWPAPWCGPGLGTGWPSQTPLLSALEVQDSGRTKATLRRGLEGPREPAEDGSAGDCLF